MSRNFDERGRSASTTASTRASSTKSQSRSTSNARHLEASESPQRKISISSNSEEKIGESPPRRSPEIELPHGPIPRPETLEALGTLSAQSYRHDVAGEPKWPREWRAYLCLFGGFLLMFNSWGLVNTYGTYSSFYMQHLLPGQDLLYLNLVGSTQSGIVLMLSAIIGRFLDAGYIRHLLVIGTIFITAGSFGLSGVNGEGRYDEGNYVLIWLTQGLISGLGMACFFVSSSQVVATWFQARKSFAIGIVASGASIAGLLYPMMTKFLIQDVGFNIATRYVAAVITATCALTVFIARPNPKTKFRHVENWFDVSIFWDAEAFTEPAYVFLVAAIAFLFFGFYAIFFNLEEWAISEGFGFRKPQGNVGLNEDIPQPPPDKSIETFWLLAIMNASSTIGRLGSAYLCDHFGALNVHAVVTTIASILVLALWTTSHALASAIAFVVIFGAFSGAVIGLPPASVAYVLGPERQSKLGQWTGMMYTCAAAFALVGPLIAGHLITEYSTYLTVQFWSGANMAMSAFCMCCAVLCRRRHDKKHNMQRLFSTATTVAVADEAENEKV